MRTFLPIFCGIGLLLVGGSALCIAFAPALAAKQEALEDDLTRLKVRRLRPPPPPAASACLHAAFTCLHRLYMRAHPSFALPRVVMSALPPPPHRCPSPMIASDDLIASNCL